MKKFWMSLLLVVALVVVLAVPAMASEEPYVKAATLTELNSALANAEVQSGEKYVKLTAEITGDPQWATGKLYLDLNGNSIDGSLTLNGAKLYLFDSATSDYDVTDGGYGTVKEIGVVGASGAEIVREFVTPAGFLPNNARHRYVAIQHTEVDGELANRYSSHRFYIGVTHTLLKPQHMALNYRVAFLGDEVIAKYVKAYGGEIGAKNCLTGASVGGSQKAGRKWVNAYTVDKSDAAKQNQFTVYVTDFLDPNQPENWAKFTQELASTACAYIQLKDNSATEDEVIRSSVASLSFRDATLAAQQKVVAGTEEAKALTAMYQHIADRKPALLQTWNLSQDTVDVPYYCLCGASKTGSANHKAGCDGTAYLWRPYSGGNITASGNFYLTGTLNNGDQLLVGEEDGSTEFTVNLDLNGYNIVASSVRVMMIYDKVNMNITNTGTKSETNGVLETTNTDQNYGTVYLGNATKANTYAVNMLDGVIIKNSTATVLSTNGGAVGIGNFRNFNMYGGKIIGSATAKNGSAIYNNGGEVTISGGTVNGGSVTSNGGAIYSTGTVNLSGGTIHGGTANHGGAVFNNGGTLEISGDAQIVGSTVTGDGGAVYSNSTLNMSGTATITGGTADRGGAVYINGGTVTLSGGEITGGTAALEDGNSNAGYAGGVYINKGDVTMSGVTITGNDAGKGTTYDDVCFNGGTLAVSDGELGYVRNYSSSNAVQLSGEPVITQLTFHASNAKIDIIGELKDSADIKVHSMADFASVESAEMFAKGDKTEEQWKAYAEYADSFRATSSQIVTYEEGGFYVRAKNGDVKYHCVCGLDAEGNHFGACDKFDHAWNAWTSTETLPNIPGKWYIPETYETTLDNNTLVKSGDVFIDLNGKIVTVKTNRRAFVFGSNKANDTDVSEYVSVTIMDSGNGGTIVNAENDAVTNHGMLFWNFTNMTPVKYPTVNIYGGHLDASKVAGSTSNTSDYGPLKGAINIDPGTTGGSASINMYGGKVSGMHARNKNDAGNGGAFYLYSTTTMNISGNAEIVGGTATQYGGAIYNNGGILNISGNAKITGGTAAQGGGIYNTGSTGKITVSGNAAITGNTANWGAGVRMNNGSLEITGGKITGNTCTGDGASSSDVYLVSGSVIARGGVIGKIRAQKDKTITVNNAPVIQALDLRGTNQILLEDGGALTVGASISVVNATQIASAADFAQYIGYFHGDGTKIVANDSTNLILHDNAGDTKYYCLCGASRTGAEHKLGCDGTVLLWSPVTSVDNLETTGNWYLTETLEPDAQIVINKTEKQIVRIDLNGNDIITNNKNRVFQVTKTNELTLTNTANTGGLVENKGSINGYGVVMTNSSTAGEVPTVNMLAGVTLRNSQTEAVAKNGGAVGVYGAYGLFRMYGGTIDGGESNTGNGGAILNQATVEIYGGTINGGTAADKGGAIYNNGGEVTISGGTVNGGSVTSNGGAIYNDGGILNISGNAKITGGNASNGGAIYTSGGEVTISGGTVNGGSVTSNGGAIYSTGTVTLSGGTIHGGTAANHGGVVFNNGGTLEISGDAQIVGGTATNNGGAVYSNSTLNMSGTATITGGNAGNMGGAIYNSGTFTMSGGSITGNTAKFGGGVTTQGSNAKFTMSGGSITDNTCTGNGASSSDVYFVSGSVIARGGVIGKIRAQEDTTITVNNAPVIQALDLKGTEQILLEKNGQLTDNASICVATAANAKIGSADLAPYVGSFRTLISGKEIVAQEDGIYVAEIVKEEPLYHCDCGMQQYNAEGALNESKGTCDAGCDGEIRKWEHLTDSSQLKTTGNYYLTQDLELSSQVVVGTSDESNPVVVRIDLNGHSINSTSRVFLLNGYCELTLTNTVEGGGKVKGKGAGNSYSVILANDEDAVMKLTVLSRVTLEPNTKETLTKGSTLALYKGVVTANLYGCTVYGTNTEGDGAAILIGDAATANLYDVKLIGANAVNGGAISNAGTLNINGVEIEAGTVTGEGAAIYSTKDILLDGKVAVDGEIHVNDKVVNLGENLATDAPIEIGIYKREGKVATGPLAVAMVGKIRANGEALLLMNGGRDLCLPIEAPAGQLLVGYGEASLSDTNDSYFNQLLQLSQNGYTDDSGKPPLSLDAYIGNRAATDVSEENGLKAAAIAYSDAEGDVILMISVDATGKSDTYSKQIRNAVAKALHVPAGNILLACTHTHSAPYSASAHTFTKGGNSVTVEKNYQDIITEAVIAAAEAALGDRAAVQAQSTATIADVNSLNSAKNNKVFNAVRNYVAKDMNGNVMGMNTPNHISYSGTESTLTPESTVDASMQLVKYVREGKDTDLVIANFQAHATLNGASDKTEIHADIVGYFRNALENVYKNTNVVYFSGASGNVDPLTKETGKTGYSKDQAASWGENLAAVVEANAQFDENTDFSTDVAAASTGVILEKMRETDEIPGRKELAAAIKEYMSANGLAGEFDKNDEREIGLINYLQEAGYTDIDDADDLYTEWKLYSSYHVNKLLTRYDVAEGATGTVNIFAYRAGDIAFAGAPYEMFDTNGKEVKDDTTNIMTIVATQANGGNGYIPSATGYQNGGYATDVTSFASGSGEQLSEAFVAMINGFYAN